MDVKLFKAVMTLSGDDCGSLAEALTITPQSLSNKINGRSDFKSTEIGNIAERWNLDPQQIAAIFFDRKVSCECPSKN